MRAHETGKRLFIEMLLRKVVTYSSMETKTHPGSPHDLWGLGGTRTKDKEFPKPRK